MSSNTKMTRLQFKALVKECLIEILQDGLGAGVGQAMGIELPVVESHRSQQQQRNRQPQRVSPLDLPASGHGQARGGQQRPAMNLPTNALADAVRFNAGGNKLMENILADTAMTTLQSQLAGEIPTHGNHGGSPPGAGRGKEQFEGSLENAFGEDVTSKWANLAFMQAPSKKSA